MRFSKRQMGLACGMLVFMLVGAPVWAAQTQRIPKLDVDVLTVDLINGFPYPDDQVDILSPTGERLVSRYATGGTGTFADPWTGWETVFDGAAAEVKFEAGYFAWVTQKTISNLSSTDRQGRWSISGAPSGGTTIFPRTVKALTFDGSAVVSMYGIDIRNLTFALDQNLGYANGIIHIKSGQHVNVDRLHLYGAPTLPGVGGASPATNSATGYTGFLLELTNTYNGDLANSTVYGRYAYFFELADTVAVPDEMDTISFRNIQVQGPMMGLLRGSKNGTHNILFDTIKIQGIISIGDDANQQDLTTLTGYHASGVTSLIVPDSSAFAVDDPVLIDVGKQLELAKVSAVPDATHITISAATRFDHQTGAQVLHGGIGVGLAATSRLITFQNCMLEQQFAGVMLDATAYLTMNNTLSTSQEMVRVVGPMSFATCVGGSNPGTICTVGSSTCTGGGTCTAGTTGLWHATINNAEISRVPGNSTHTIASIATGTDIITVPSNTNLNDLAPTVYTAASPAAPLVTGTTYYVIRLSSTTIKLATTLANAIARTAIDLTTAGSGTQTLDAVTVAYGIHVTTTGDSVNVRELSIKNMERNSSATNTLYEYANDATQTRNYFLDRVVSGNNTEEHYFTAGLTTTPVESFYTGNVAKRVLTAAGTETLAGMLCFEGATDDTFEGCFIPTDPQADRTWTMQDASGTVAFLGDIPAPPGPSSTPLVWWLPAFSNCASLSADWDNQVAPSPSSLCNSGSNSAMGSWNFPDLDDDYSVETLRLLPANWTGTIDAKIKWYTSDIAGSVFWQVSTSCITDGAPLNSAFNAANTVSDPAQGIANRMNEAIIPDLTTTGCSPGDLMFVKVTRNRASPDTIGAVAVQFVGLELTLQTTP